jgi:hypothetical protein
MSEETTPQPPAQKLDVAGFESHGPMGSSKIDWPRLAKLPPFQMFIEEHAPNTLGEPADKFAMLCTAKMCEMVAPDAFYASYVAWHGAKGYWPHETPDGRPR